MRAKARRPERPPGLVGPPPAFDYARDRFDPSGPLSTVEWYAREAARFEAEHRAFLTASAAWSERARSILGVDLDVFEVLFADHAPWPWPSIPADVRHLCTTDPKENPA